MTGSPPHYAVVAALISLVLSIGAASLALKLYTLLRTGRMGASWRILIIASVIFAAVQAMRLFEVISPFGHSLHLSSIFELIFVLALAYAFFLQKQVFEEHHDLLPNNIRDTKDKDDVEPVEVSAYEHY